MARNRNREGDMSGKTIEERRMLERLFRRRRLLDKFPDRVRPQVSPSPAVLISYFSGGSHD